MKMGVGGGVLLVLWEIHSLEIPAVFRDMLWRQGELPFFFVCKCQVCYRAYIQVRNIKNMIISQPKQIENFPSNTLWKE